MNTGDEADNYVPPTDIYDFVEPGSGPIEFMNLVIAPESRLLRAIALTIDDGRQYPLSTSE